MLFKLDSILNRRYEHVVLATMLFALHFALRAGLGGPLSAALMTAHLGLFFIWQPIWQRDQHLDPRSFILILLFTGVFVAALNWWFVFIWLILLIGIVSGRTIATASERLVYMLTLAYLVSELLITCVLQLFRVETLAPAAVELFRLLLLLVPAVLLFLPVKPVHPGASVAIDFVRGVNFSLMTALLAVSSVLVTYQVAIDYPVALFSTLLAMAGFLSLISWLLTPNTGVGNLFHLWERSLLSIGTPFEQWLTRLARAAARDPEPTSFLDAAAAQLVEVPFVTGVEWRAQQRTGRIGAEARFKFDFDRDDLSLSLYTARNVGPMLLLHYKLLLELIAHFYVAILRGHEQSNQSHIQAVYETGARLTHDIKNLLQALQTLTAELTRLPDVPESADEIERQRRGQALLRRQLPAITQRLQLALDKLQAPAARSPVRGSLRSWWMTLRDRYADSGCRFIDRLGPDRTIPVDCFDSVAENLLENALQKAKTETAIAVTITAESDATGERILVCDSGSAIDPGLAATLFSRAVASRTGLGIGLYQAARQAERSGYRLDLIGNRNGEVCFALSGDPQALSRQAAR